MAHANPPRDTTSHSPVVGDFSDTPKKTAKGSNEAADLIRQKIDKLFAAEPDAKQEIAEAKAARPRSKHQQFMYDLSTSGKGLAEIQTAWHNYYVALSDEEKHQVWQEFYEANSRTQYATAQPQAVPRPPHAHQPLHRQTEEAIAVTHASTPASSRRAHTNPQSIRMAVLDKVGERADRVAKHQGVRSLAFGLSMGFVSLAVLLFGLFNEVVVTPFIQPSRNADATPIIFSKSTVAATGEPQVVIPKINVQIPVDYSLQTSDEDTIQNALNDAVVHYPSTVKPGQTGNVAIFGHSSNNIFNKGKYKFAFVLLSQMQPGDVFYLTYDDKVYAYKVYEKKVVNPSDTWVLDPVEGRSATTALITCDPPGTSLKRLVVWGEQVSPDPAANIAGTPTKTASAEPAAITGNGPNMASRLLSWLNPFD